MDTHEVVGYSPRDWCIAMFLPDKVLPNPQSTGSPMAGSADLSTNAKAPHHEDGPASKE